MLGPTDEYNTSKLSRFKNAIFSEMCLGSSWLANCLRDNLQAKLLVRSKARILVKFQLLRNQSFAIRTILFSTAAHQGKSYNKEEKKSRSIPNKGKRTSICHPWTLINYHHRFKCKTRIPAFQTLFFFFSCTLFIQ